MVTFPALPGALQVFHLFVAAWLFFKDKTAWGLLLYVCPEARNINHWNSVPKRAAEPQTLSLFKAVTKVKKEYGLSTWK